MSFLLLIFLFSEWGLVIPISCLKHDGKNFLHQGITAILNFQSGIEAENWGINFRSINESCQKFNILMINYPIR